jgi:queuine tRNA-ribosyltransferase accessory subunit
MKKYPGSARDFLGLDASIPCFATAKDPFNPKEYTLPMRKATDDYTTAITPMGARSITPEQYMETVALLRPEALVALSDEMTPTAKRVRAVKSAERSLDWLRRCLGLRDADAALQGTPVFAAVQGGRHAQVRSRCASEAAATTEVAGFCVAGLGTGEAVEARRQALAAVLPELPEEKPRMAHGVAGPWEVAEAVAMGVDIFDGGYIAKVTELGHALVFPLCPKEHAELRGEYTGLSAHDAASTESRENGQDELVRLQRAPERLDLWSAEYAEDPRPLLPGCDCPACSGGYTRAYVHHLLKTHEMLSPVLLEAHNTRRYQAYFARLRIEVATGGLDTYREWLAEAVEPTVELGEREEEERGELAAAG